MVHNSGTIPTLKMNYDEKDFEYGPALGLEIFDMSA
jgi:hypothetical protein